MTYNEKRLNHHFRKTHMEQLNLITNFLGIKDKNIIITNENSWGDKVGQKGYFVASDAWMDEYTYQIVVRKDFLTAEELAAYEADPQVLAPWDPMGSLASK